VKFRNGKKRRSIMLSVTSLAKEKMRHALQAKQEDEDSLIRITRSSDPPHALGFLIDTEKEGDEVIRDSEGEKLLLIGEEIGPTLAGLVLDYRDTDQGMRFTITQS
jgi:Fe-S cluster assembly iron-binding protein IscA